MVFPNGHKLILCVLAPRLNDLRKSGQEFWKIWRSKFGNKSNDIVQVDGVSDNGLITDKFAVFFECTCSPITNSGSDELRLRYHGLRSPDPLPRMSC